MENKFLQLNRKIRRATVIKFAIMGVSVGAMVFSAAVLAYKLQTLTPNLVVSGACGGVAALVLFAALMFVNFPTEKRVAKRLDGKLSFGEKAQTMVEFKSIDGDMLEIQREDTERRLAEISKKALRNKKLWKSFVLPLLAIALTATAFAVPVRTVEQPPIIGPNDMSDEWELTDWHITAVRNLIETVKESGMVEEGRDSVVSHLETMLSDLQYIKSKAQMKQTVNETMVKISKVTDGINTYTSVLKALKSSGNTETVKYAEALGSPSDPIVESKYNALRVSFKKSDAEDMLGGFAHGLSVATDSMSVPNTDKLYEAIKSFAQSISEFDKTADSLDDTAFADGLNKIFEDAAQKLGAALGQQYINRQTSDNANKTLMDIFGIEWSELPDELKYPQNEEAGTTGGDYEEKDDEDIVNGGGLGGGEVIYGSNDAVYDPENEKHVIYGDLINEYDAKKAAELEERPMPDELKDAVGDYFDNLYYNSEKKD